MLALSSDDPFIMQYVQEDLSEHVRQKTTRLPTPEEICEYLSGSVQVNPNDPGKANLWSRARSAALEMCKRFQVSWSFCSATEQFLLTLKKDERVVNIPESSCHLAFRQITFQSNYYLEILAAKLDQNKTALTVAANSASNHFIWGGEGVRFCD